MWPPPFSFPLPCRTPTLTMPCQSRRPLAVLVRTSSWMVSGTLGRLGGEVDR